MFIKGDKVIITSSYYASHPAGTVGEVIDSLGVAGGNGVFVRANDVDLYYARKDLGITVFPLEIYEETQRIADLEERQGEIEALHDKVVDFANERKLDGISFDVLMRPIHDLMGEGV